ncbi:MAG: diaminopimelate decarboxylase [Bdellovibrionales bacterium]
MFERASFSYVSDQLSLSSKGAKTPLINYTEGMDRPVYVYNLDTISKRIDAYKEAFKGFKNHIHYAVKANPNLELMAFMKSKGLGADIVSIGEFNRALEAGFDSSEIIFSGVGKSRSEITEALEKDVFQINCECLSEIKRVVEIAKSIGKKTSIGIRLNPDISVDTHPYISTGFKENKFGLPLEQLPAVSRIVAASEGFVTLQGVSCHIGSQIMSTDPLVKALESVLRVQKELNLMGHEIKYLDLGGGLGVDYHSNDEAMDLKSIAEFGEKITPLLKDFKGEVLFEPGRSLVARAGVLLTRVEYIKNNGFKDFVIVNTGMHHLMRPSLYSAYHKIVPLKFDDTRPVKNFDVVGPICESSDVVGYDRSLQVPEEGEWMAVMDAGAYGMSMASAYNIHAFPAEVLV